MSHAYVATFRNGLTSDTLTTIALIETNPPIVFDFNSRIDLAEVFSFGPGMMMISLKKLKNVKNKIFKKN